MTRQLSQSERTVLDAGTEWLDAHEEALVDLLTELVARPSITGREGRRDDPASTVGHLVAALEEQVDRTDVVTERLPDEWEYRDGAHRENVYTVLQGGDDGALVCTSHTDVVSAGAPDSWPDDDPYSIQRGTVTRVGETTIELDVAGDRFEREVRAELARSWDRRGVGDGRSLEALVGRGVYDNKASIVCLVGSLLALEAALDDSQTLGGDLVHGHLVDEEVYQVGAKRMVGWDGREGWLDEQYDGYDDFRAVVLEGSYGFAPVIGHRGLVWLELEATGEAAHASTPDLGRNAVVGMAKALADADDPAYANAVAEQFVEDRLLGETTVAPGTTVVGGDVRAVEDGYVDRGGLNAIPEWCEATFDVRIPRWEGFPDGVDEVQAALCETVERRARAAGGVEFSARIPEHGFFPPVALADDREEAGSHPLVETAIAAATATAGYEPAIEVAPGATDAAFVYHGTHAPTLVEYGPAGALSHEPLEFVEREHVLTGAKAMLEFAVRELGVLE
ncbi:M20 family metallopeptidase [Natrarchaeobius sp. A-rgal3]|uniref:M20 family metallopeptidase n=1 Tax=Natrarchaeobius versutus TaxID=1679078 RepID=UPI00350F5546